MQLGGVAVDVYISVVQLFLQPDVGGNNEPDHLQRVPDNHIQVHGLEGGGVRLLAAERQNLLHDFLGPGSRLVNLRNVLKIFALSAQLLFQKLRIPQNGRQKIVELVGDAPGQRAYGGQLLVMARLLPALVQFLQCAVDLL